MQDHVKIFEDYLKKHNLKLTRPRHVILAAVFANHSHFDVDALYDQIHQKYTDVSRATIYRTMPLLIEAGLIKRSLRSQARDHYEHIFGHKHHLHLICNKCGSIIEAESAAVEALLQNLAKRYNFTITECNIGARGLCEKCRE